MFDRNTFSTDFWTWIMVKFRRPIRIFKCSQTYFTTWVEEIKNIASILDQHSISFEIPILKGLLSLYSWISHREKRLGIWYIYPSYEIFPSLYPQNFDIKWWQVYCKGKFLLSIVISPIFVGCQLFLKTEKETFMI